MRDNTGMLGCEVSRKGESDASDPNKNSLGSEAFKSLREQRWRGLDGMVGSWLTLVLGLF